MYDELDHDRFVEILTGSNLQYQSRLIELLGLMVATADSSDIVMMDDTKHTGDIACLLRVELTVHSLSSSMELLSASTC